MNVFGATRSRIRTNYALITPDTHVPSPRMGWENTTAFVHISPELGARFTQFTAVMTAGAKSALPENSVQRMIFVNEGSVTVECAEIAAPASLSAEGFAYFPAGCPHTISTNNSAALTVFEKVYVPLQSVAPPRPIISHENKVEALPFLGDPAARLKTLLPIEPAFDMAVNIFTYQPGATLPFVEIHIMEHGLLMLQGAGVYRLGDDYYPIAVGDIIWMASYCPQWFVAMGKEPARYLYYKDIHRDGIEGKS